MTLDDLATMVKGGFDSVDEQLADLRKGQKVLENGQEEIKLRLDNVAYRFELIELQKRIEVL